MIIRKYRPDDCKAVAELFYNTVHTINAKDYRQEQLNVWATGKVDLEKWNASFLQHYTVVATITPVQNCEKSFSNSINCAKIVAFEKTSFEESATIPFENMINETSFNENGLGELIIGFGDIDETGYLDRLYVHKDYQKQGVGAAICDELERYFNEAFLHSANNMALSESEIKNCELCEKTSGKTLANNCRKELNKPHKKDCSIAENEAKNIEFSKKNGQTPLDNGQVCRKITTHASITAKGFFESRGYKAIKEQQVERGGVLLTNFIMEKML